MNLRIQSVQHPFDDPSVMPVAIAALSRADAMGLLPGKINRLDLKAMLGLETGMAEAQIGQGFVAELHRLPNVEPAALAALLEKIVEALNESPAPAHEWRALQGILGPELLGRLLGVSLSSVRRYLAGARSTPDTVAVRLHFLALVVGDLAGAYNSIGVRRWFDRPRTLLKGNTPADLLGKNWRPEDGGPRRARELAQSLTASPVT